MKASDLAGRYRVVEGNEFRLGKVDPDDTAGLDVDKEEAKQLIASNLERLRKLQERLYAEGERAVLIVLQAMDAGGKDSVIEHVMTGINPQGCDVKSFKQPGPVELRHDFLWRHVIGLPQRGKIVIFNRSHYEEVLVVRVHPEILEGQRLPKELRGKDIWERRFRSIRDFESHVVESGTTVLTCTSPRTSRHGGSSIASTSRTRTGSFPSATSRNASTGTTTWTPSRT